MNLDMSAQGKTRKSGKGKGQAIPLPTLDANSDDAETPDPADVAAQLIEPGRALALADFRRLRWARGTADPAGLSHGRVGRC
jgi:hypothetical protein